MRFTRFPSAAGFVGGSGAAANVITKAGRFDGVDEYAYPNDATRWNIGGDGNDVTICVGFRCSNLTASNTIAAKFRSSAGLRLWALQVRSNVSGEGRALVYGTNNLQKDYTTSMALNDGLKHLLGFTYDASLDEMKLWVDGSEDTPTKAADNAFSGIQQDTTTVRPAIGALENSSGVFTSFADADITCVAAWQGYALNASDWAELWDGGDIIRPATLSAAPPFFAYDFMEPGDDMTGTTGIVQDSAPTPDGDFTPINTEPGDLVSW